jgi:four helix bundle protein
LIVWQKARLLCKHIFEITASGSFKKDFALIDQINRSSGSVMDNIAEGFGRLGNREFILFLTYANASCQECKSQVIRAADRNYITPDKTDELIFLINEICKMEQSMISYLQKCGMRGRKFK